MQSQCSNRRWDKVGKKTRVEIAVIENIVTIRISVIGVGVLKCTATAWRKALTTLLTQFSPGDLPSWVSLRL